MSLKRTLAAASVLLAAAAHGSELPYVQTLKGGQAAAGPPRLIVRASPKVELVMLVASRADHQRTINIPRDDNELGSFWSGRSQALSYAEAPKHLRDLRQKGLWGDALLTYAVHLSDPPALERLLPWPESLLRQPARASAPAPSELDKFREELIQFGELLRFTELMGEKQADYRRLEEQVRGHLAGGDPVRINSDFWGIQPGGDVYLIPSPLINGGYLASVQAGGKTHEFLAFGPALPETVDNENLLHHLVHHELSHPLLDPLLRRHAAELESSSALWVPLTEWLVSSRNLLTWTDGISEHLLRAYNIHLLRQNNPMLAELSVTSEKEIGYIYIRPFMEILAEYAGDRKTYPDFGAFMPRLAERLKGLAARARDLNPITRTPEFDIINPGFEEADGAWMARGWDLVKAGNLPGSDGRELARISRDTTVAHGGGSSLRLEVSPATTGLVAVEQAPLAVRAGGTVRVSAWVKARGVERQGLQQKVCGLYVLFQDRQGEVLSRGETDSAVGTLDWTELTGEFVAPAGTSRLTVGILLGMSGTAWFDDLKLVRVD